MRIREFGVEMWMNLHENHCRYNLAETCVESLTVAELLHIAGKSNAILEELMPMKLTYGAIEGSERLREGIAGLYARQEPENVITTHGAIGANALLHAALVEPGDRVVSIMPNYQQHHSIPESYGADLAVLDLRAGDGYLPDLDELRRLADGRAKLIAFSNPNNPTGAVMDERVLGGIVEIARQCGAWVLSDEVYRGLEDEEVGAVPSIVDLYERGIAVGSMSKAFSLAGLRLGWIAAPAEIIRAVSIHRDYTTISVGMLDDHFAAIALENKDAILARNRAITLGNREKLASWVESEPSISWVRPRSGTIGLLRYDLPMPSRAFCERLLAETGVLMTPGSAMDMEGHVRIGYANAPEILDQGLAETSRFLRSVAG